MVAFAVGEGDDDAIGGKKEGEFFSPLDQHEGVGFEDVFEAEGVELAGLVEAVEIDVINADGFAVFVDEGERGAGDLGGRGDAEGFDEGGDQGGFTGTEVPR